jgi:predicted exporter
LYYSLLTTLAGKDRLFGNYPPDTTAWLVGNCPKIPGAAVAGTQTATELLLDIPVVITTVAMPG